MANPLVPATFKRSPSDFVVDELPAYAPSGEGEHVFIRFRKEGRATLDVVRELSRLLDVDDRGVGYAGLKDKHAITTQTVSLPIPLARDAAEELFRVTLPGVTILDVTRHGHKLKPGHLAGNRFRIVLHDVAPELVGTLIARLEQAGRDGVPNAFGPQRFGRDGDNPERAFAWLSGRTRGPRDKRERRLWFSAVQSLLFNRVLERRVEDASWARVLPGDLAKKHDSGGMFLVAEEGEEREEAEARAARGEISATGPMFGAKMRWPEGRPADLEREVLGDALGDLAALDVHKNLGAGTRRPLRILPEGMEVQPPATPDGGLVVSFVLPKGGYATTVLGCACQLHDASHTSHRDNAHDRGQPPREELASDEASPPVENSPE